ncbi:chitin binding protein [Phlyctema vagabunda]|uniref:Chitin binding protein n=1 Tax=Phlyctema vagabunda TaxID=108571 RepID=A0ABR4PU94_9HELO
MQYSSSILIAAAGLITSVSAHGAFSDPKPRAAGTAMESGCGQQVFNNQASDSFGNIQGMLQVAASQTDFDAAACNIWLCKGFKFEDNSANVQSWTAGQVVPLTFDIRAPHAGVANVSIVDTATNSIIGSPLVSYADFANNARPTEADQLKFSITIPSDLGSACATAGACVVQHYWDAASIDQTYESCIDFTVGGTGAAPVGSSSSAVVSSVVATSSAAPVATSASVVPTTLQTVASSSSVAVPTTLQTVIASSSAVVPTTLQTQVASSVASSAVVPSATPAPEDEYDCE